MSSWLKDCLGNGNQPRLGDLLLPATGYRESLRVLEYFTSINNDKQPANHF